jgi:D-alanyl-D-alanine carboxypeptidase
VFVLVVSSLLAAASGEASQPLAPALRQRIDADVGTVLRRWDVPGAAIAVIRDGRRVYAQAWGLRDREKRLPVTVDTPFEIGSITKQFTAAAILQLQEAGKLDINATVDRYLPDAPHARETTLRQLLSHTSGLPDYFDGPNIEAAASKPITFSGLIDRIASKPLDFAPGAQWHYSNTGYILLGRILEIVSHHSYRDYIQAHLIDPVGLTQTHRVADEPRIAGMAVGYHHAGGKLERSQTISDSFGWAAGNLVSTLKDLDKWNQALQGGKVVTAADYALMSTSVKTLRGDAGYGLGLFVGEVEGQPRIGHTGGSFGFTTANEYFPNQHVQIIAFTNQGDDTPEPGEVLAQAVFHDLFPEVAALAARATDGESATTTALAQSVFATVQAGTGDYGSFNARLGGKLKTGLAERLAKEFGPYGPATSFIFKATRRDSDLQWFDYVIQFGPGCSLKFAVALDAEGKVASLSFG